MKKHNKIRSAVRKNYGRIASENRSGCGCSGSSCCGAEESANTDDIALGLGYSNKEVSSVPEGANLGLGCGAPLSIASLKKGETVLDLGSGAGFDAFLAAKEVGEKGAVIGVDMTPEMVERARINAKKSGIKTVDFRLGEIEHLPVADSAADVIISNCVINLSPEKEKVFKEAWRVLKPGGRLAISDVVATAELPADIKKDLELHSACVAGASSILELRAMLNEAGFEDIIITPKCESKEFIRNWAPGRKIEEYIVSALIRAVKPAKTTS